MYKTNACFIPAQPGQLDVALQVGFWGAAWTEDPRAVAVASIEKRVDFMMTRNQECKNCELSKHAKQRRGTRNSI